MGVSMLGRALSLFVVGEPLARVSGTRMLGAGVAVRVLRCFLGAMGGGGDRGGSGVV